MDRFNGKLRAIWNLLCAPGSLGMALALSHGGDAIFPGGYRNTIFFLNVGFILGGPLFGWLSDNIIKSRKWIVISGLSMLIFILFVLAFLPAGTGILWSGCFPIGLSSVRRLSFGLQRAVFVYQRHGQQRK